jgi:hypothetical protein
MDVPRTLGLVFKDCEDISPSSTLATTAKFSKGARTIERR